jgi:hypothetical protein
MVSVPVAASARCEAQVDLHHDDLLAFGVARQLIDEGRTPEVAATWYFENGSAALRAYARTYDVTPQRFARRHRSHPRFYRQIAGSASRYLSKSGRVSECRGFALPTRPDAHRDRIRREFQAIMHKPAREAVGWFSGIPEPTDDRPPALGYAVGFDICKAFLDQAGASEARTLELLSARSDDFARVARAYGQLPETVGGDFAG